MKYKYYVGEKIAYLFSTEDDIHLKVDMTIDKNLLSNGINLMKTAYNNDSIVYEEIKESLDLNQNLLTLNEFQNIANTPNEKNYNKYKNSITMELYQFIKNLSKEAKF